jgi:hemerythrin-like domain-containing protein
MLPLKKLVQEHMLIIKMLDALRGLAALAGSGGKVSVQKLDYAAKFLQEFIGRFHFGKEEEAFFPYLESMGIDRHDRIIEILLSDHQQARQYVSTLVGAIENYKKGQARALIEAAETIYKYCGLISKHTEKENKTIVLHAAQTLKEQDYAELTRRFEKIEHETIGKNALEEYEGLVEKIN